MTRTAFRDHGAPSPRLCECSENLYSDFGLLFLPLPPRHTPSAATHQHIEMSQLAAIPDFSHPKQLKEFFCAVIIGFQAQLHQLTKDIEALECQLTR